MAASDAVSHSLRGLVGNATRYGHFELAEEYRQELRLHTAEQALAKIFDDAPALTAPQLRRLKLVLESYGRPRKAVAPEPTIDDRNDPVAV